jgi:DsbC/DsbD-like thiol-disulfide interchange protein/cytochrome c biogenesis protein CcdA
MCEVRRPPAVSALLWSGYNLIGTHISGMPSFRQCALILCAGLSVAAAAGANPSTVPAKPLGVPVAGPVRAQHLTVELLPLEGSIQPGGSATIGLHFALDKGWHVYWVNAGDSGEPPGIKWTLPPGITAGAMQFPAPRRLPLGPLMDFGYEDEVLFPMTLSAASSLKVPSTAELSAHVSWLVCREVCIPGKADLALPLQVASQQGLGDPGRQALFDRFRDRLPRPLPSSSQAVFGATSTGFDLAFTGHPTANAEFFPLDQSQIANAAPQPVRSVDGGIEISLKRDENFRAQLAQLNGVVVLGDGTAYEIHAPPGPLPAASVGAGGFAALLRAVSLAFIGGMILNLMPCVFPVLFIKGLALVESSRHHETRIRAHGLVYALGILVSFWAVVALLLGLRAGGRHLGWGFQFQSPGFVAVMALLLFFLGLSLAGMFEIGLTVTSAGSGLAARHGYAGSFFTGVLAVIVATPCTAPFMGAAIGFALAQSAATAFAVFTALALGLAAPYLLLTLNPAWMRLLPRPGAWMEVLKQATAVPIFATVIWLVWLFASSAGFDALSALLAAFLLLAIAGWILGRWPARRVSSAFATAVIALAVATPLYTLWKFPASDANTARAATGSSHEGWQPYSRAAIQQYRAQGRPVFVDFTARWCLSCQVNERVVLDRPDVRRRLHDSGIVLIRADWTRHDADIAGALSELGRSGVPTYVLYLPKQPPLILSELLTPGIVFEALDQIQAHPKDRPKQVADLK